MCKRYYNITGAFKQSSLLLIIEHGKKHSFRGSTLLCSCKYLLCRKLCRHIAFRPSGECNPVQWTPASTQPICVHCACPLARTHGSSTHDRVIQPQIIATCIAKRIQHTLFRLATRSLWDAPWDLLVAITASENSSTQNATKVGILAASAIHPGKVFTAKPELQDPQNMSPNIKCGVRPLLYIWNPHPSCIHVHQPVKHLAILCIKRKVKAKLPEGSLAVYSYIVDCYRD